MIIGKSHQMHPFRINKQVQLLHQRLCYIDKTYVLLAFKLIIRIDPHNDRYNTNKITYIDYESSKVFEDKKN